MSRRIRVVALLPFLLVAAGTARSAEPARYGLWHGSSPIGAPGDSATEEADAFITVHLPPGGAERKASTAVVICPGGGYGGLVTGPEGHGIATWLNAHGIAGVVLEYRLPKGRPFVPLADASRALRTVRSNAAAWQIDPRRVGIMGFSAGGHLASTAATHFDDGNAKATDPIEKESSRPDFAILVYPVVTMGGDGHSGSRTNLLGESPDPGLLELFSNEKQVTKHTPPVYLAHAIDDAPVPIANSRMFHEACKRAEVPSRLIELPRGGHGLDGYQGPNWDAWQSGALEWLATLELVPAAATARPRRMLVRDRIQGGRRTRPTTAGFPLRGRRPWQRTARR
jgi:acetyl esterase/lipase